MSAFFYHTIKYLYAKLFLLCISQKSRTPLLLGEREIVITHKNPGAFLFIATYAFVRK